MVTMVKGTEPSTAACCRAPSPPPSNRRKPNNPMVASAPRLARNWIPRSTPEVADARNTAVMMTMMTTVTPLDLSSPVRYSRPLFSCNPLRPSDVAVPNRVATMARASMVRPAASRAPLHRVAVKVALTSIGVPLRKEKYASAPPMIA